jgi:photosystem II core protein PsbZ
MITALTTILVLVSLGLVITVPVALATPGEWENSKESFTKGFQGWIFLVFALLLLMVLHQHFKFQYLNS